MNANLNEMSNKQLSEFIAENNIPKPKGRPTKDALIAYIKTHFENIQMGEEDINRANPAVVVEEEEERCYTCEKLQSELGEPLIHCENPRQSFLYCEDCYAKLEDSPKDEEEEENFFASDDEEEEESEEDEEDSEDEKSCGGGASCEDCGNNREDNGECFDCEIAPNIVGGEVAPAEDEEPIFNGDRCPVCLDEECSTYTDTCEHMLCGGCFGMLPEKNWVGNGGNGWMTTNPIRECPICRSICRGVKEGQTSNSDKIREWRDLKKRIAEYEAGKAHIQVHRVVQRVVVNAEGQEVAAPARQPRVRQPRVRQPRVAAVALGGGGQPPERPAGRNAEVVLAEGAVLGDIHFDARPRLRCRGTDNGDGGNAVHCATNTRRVCPQCRNKRLCLGCGDRCADCLA